MNSFSLINQNKTVVSILLVVVATALTLLVLSAWPDSQGSGPPSIREITLGTLRRADEADKPNPRLKTESSYPSNAPLALRVISSGRSGQSIKLQARLLTTDGQVKVITPSQIELPVGRSTFCCWRISEAGKYVLQIFRPDQTITSIPLWIERGESSGPGLRVTR